MTSPTDANRMRWNGVLRSEVITRCNALLSRGIRNDRSNSYTGIPVRPSGTAHSRTKWQICGIWNVTSIMQHLLLHPSRGVKYCNELVCEPVCSHDILTKRLNFIKFSVAHTPWLRCLVINAVVQCILGDAIFTQHDFAAYPAPRWPSEVQYPRPMTPVCSATVPMGTAECPYFLPHCRPLLDRYAARVGQWQGGILCSNWGGCWYCLFTVMATGFTTMQMNDYLYSVYF